MGDDDDCLAMCGGCAADMDGGCGEVKRAWAEAGGRGMTATATEAATGEAATGRMITEEAASVAEAACAAACDTCSWT